jgi:hypothetical protein
VKDDKSDDKADVEENDDALPPSSKDITNTSADDSSADDSSADDSSADEPAKAGAGDDDADDDAPPVTPAKSRTKRSAAARSKLRERESAPARAVSKPSGRSLMSRSILLVVVGLGVGVAGGWFLREAKAKGRMPFQQAATEASGISEECKSWKDKICAESGEASAGCAQAQSAAELLPIAACGAALEDVPDTLSRLSKAREVCVDLVTKLCSDLGKESQECGLVRTKAETIPPEACRSMQENYPAVLAQLRTMQEQGALMKGMQGAGPPGHPGPGAAPPAGMRPMRMPPPGGMLPPTRPAEQPE